MILPLRAAAAVLVLNEILYDPAGPDVGREFVELLALEAVALTGWTLEAGDGARSTWRVVWRGGGELAPGDFRVAGGDSVREATERLSGDLQNGPDAVRLVDPQGRVHDRVGWGDLADAELFEGRPAADVSGASLARDPDGADSDDNRRDFVAAVASPGRRNRPRRDLALALAPPDPLVARPGRTVRASITVRNRGLEPASAGWDLRARWLRIAAGETLAARAIVAAGGLGAALAPGDSARLVLAVRDEPGLYRLEVHGVFADEDTTGERVAAWVRLGAGDLFIDEILYAPRSGEPEWIEVRNRGPVAVPLAGFTLTDQSGRRGLVRGGARLAPGARGVIAPDTTTVIPALAPGTPRWAATPWPSLNDTGEGPWADALVLRDAAGIVSDACGYPAAARERGRSLERIAADAATPAGDWSVCTAPAGCTPGARNTAFDAAAGAGATAFDLAPNPFSPNADGADDRLVVRAVVPDGYEGCRIEIYDLDGKRRARLLADSLGPGARTVAWAGTSDSGNLLDAGAYVCVFECYSKLRPVLRLRRAVGLVR